MYNSSSLFLLSEFQKLRENTEIILCTSDEYNFYLFLLGLPQNFNDENFAPPETANCIVSFLCERYTALAVEATTIKEYSLKPYLKKLFTERVLRGDQSTYSGILEALNFDGNNKAINKVYEQHVLSIGDLDERIFLGKNILIVNICESLTNAMLGESESS